MNTADNAVAGIFAQLCAVSAVFAFVAVKHKLRLPTLSFGIVAPQAFERTAL